MKRDAISCILSRSELFAGATKATLSAAATAATATRHAPGDFVLRQEDPPAQLFLVAEGLVKVSRISPGGDEITLHFMAPGELVGCAAVFRGFPYPASAMAVEPSVVLAWDSGQLSSLMAEHPVVTLNALRIVGGRLRDFVTRLGEMTSGRAEQRIARALLRLANQTGSRVEGGIEVRFQASLRDIEEMTNVTYHTVSRTLSAWKKQGMVESGRRRILIKAPHLLFKIAEDL